MSGREKSRSTLFDYPTRVLWAVTIMVLTALLSNLLLLRNAAVLGEDSLVGVDVDTFTKRFEELRPLLPGHGVIGYASGPNSEQLNRQDDVYADLQQEYRLAQYVLAPVILRPATSDAISGLSFLIVDEYGGRFFSLEPRKKVDPPEGFTLARDFGNGLLLFVRGPL
jgi:hypothetical protein